MSTLTSLPFADIATLIIDSNRGIYRYQAIARKFELSRWKGCNPNDYQTILSGPDCDGYNEAFQYFSASAVLESKDGDLFLYEDENGDIWFLPEKGFDRIQEVDGELFVFYK